MLGDNHHHDRSPFYTCIVNTIACSPGVKMADTKAMLRPRSTPGGHPDRRGPAEKAEVLAYDFRAPRPIKPESMA
jgi:hypothetical protein